MRQALPGTAAARRAGTLPGAALRPVFVPRWPSAREAGPAATGASAPGQRIIRLLQAGLSRGASWLHDVRTSRYC